MIGRYRHDERKVAAARERTTNPNMRRKLHVDVEVKRGIGRYAGLFEAYACVSSRGRVAGRCEHGVGSSPTQAAKRALIDLAARRFH